MIAYFDCFSGISGDMTLGALTDLGVPLKWLKEKLTDIPLEGFDISIEKALRQGIHANRVTVRIAENPPSRTYRDIKDLLAKSRLPARVKETALAVFGKLAEAEARIHNEEKDQVHFHEIGALDSIVDIVGTALCLTYLDIEKVISSKIPLGKGFVSCRHGRLPLPAPATVEILKHIPVYGSGMQQELVTPTGAAIIATIAERFEDLPEMKIEAIGYGAGLRDTAAMPNVLRVIKGMPGPAESFLKTGEPPHPIVMLETCIDDMNPEFYGYLMDRLFEDGALDVYWIPLFMKKNRPGTLIQVLCEPEKRQALVHRILTETTSTGVRFHEIQRQTLARKTVMVQTPYGVVQVKRITGPNDRVRFVPEYEACRNIALSLQIPLYEVYAEISRTAGDNTLTKTPPDCRNTP
jgi:uncharacterized protein (TIGR00299 family) protein